MRDRYLWPTWRPWAAGLVALVTVAGTSWGQQGTSTTSARDQTKEQSKGKSGDDHPVVRTFGTEGGYRTEVTSQTKGKLTQEEQRQASLLVAQVFEHIGRARDAIDADETKKARHEVDKGREAINAIRAMLPRTTLRTKTTTPDGKVIYEDEREVQESRIPLFEGMLHTQTLAPILAARRNALEVAGVRVVESENIVTEAIADIDVIEGQLARAAKALEQNKEEEAARAMTRALVRGLELRVSKEDSTLASARDAIWLARRSLEENNPTQAIVNLESARRRLVTYRELLSQDQRQEVDQMLREIAQLEGELRQQGNQQVSRAERAHQTNQLTHWWDRLNSWFRRHL